MRAFLKKLYDTGFTHIFSANVLNKIISMASGLLIVNFLSKEQYGVYSYANNALNTFLIVSGLGGASAILQLGSENMDYPEKQGAFYRLGFLSGETFNGILMIAILLFSLFFPFPIKEARPILALMAFLPCCIYMIDSFAARFRMRMMNQEFSYLSTSIAFLSAVFLILGGMLRRLEVIVLLRYVAYFFVIVFFLFRYRETLNPFLYPSRALLRKSEVHSFFTVALVSLVNNSLGSLLYTIDGWTIGGIVQDASVLASYHTATLVPFALSFIPSTIVTYIYPYVAKHYQDRDWLVKNLPTLYKVMMVVNAVISAGLFLSAPLILRFFFPKYLDALPIFRVLAVGYFFQGSFRILSGNILVMLHKLQWNTVVAVVSGLLNIVLDIVLIYAMGSMGAAIATVSIFIVSGLMSTAYLIHHIRRMPKGISPKEGEGNV